MNKVYLLSYILILVIHVFCGGKAKGTNDVVTSTYDTPNHKQTTKQTVEV